MQFSHLTPRHSDVVHDIKFDFYGNRFATCSSDRDIKVWDLLDATGKWRCHTIQHAHAANIWRLAWAHPQYGKIFASCSEDTTVNIFEEQAQISQQLSSVTSAPLSEAKPNSKWHRKKSIAVSKRPVHDVAFAPPHLGLMLATASQDGKVKFYEPAHVFDIKDWTSTSEFQAEVPSPSSLGVLCVSWNMTEADNPSIAVGGASRRPSIWVLANKLWQQECVLEQHGEAVYDIAWAPCMGRPHHLIATASREKLFRIHKLQRDGNGGFSYVKGACQVVSTASEVWRVTWNATGTVLATSGEDGQLSLWRTDFNGEWINVQTLPRFDEILA